jgi:hypothetical protein
MGRGRIATDSGSNVCVMVRQKFAYPQPGREKGTKDICQDASKKQAIGRIIKKK